MAMVSHRRLVERVEWVQSFHWEKSPGAGYSIPCNHTGSVTRGHRKHYKELLKTPGLVHDGLRVHRWSYWEPAVLACLCAETVTLYDPLTNGCDRCGREYNLSGQLLASDWREAIREETGEVF
jgi:hypothetical protein